MVNEERRKTIINLLWLSIERQSSGGSRKQISEQCSGINLALMLPWITMAGPAFCCMTCSRKKQHLPIKPQSAIYSAKHTIEVEEFKQESLINSFLPKKACDNNSPCLRNDCLCKLSSWGFLPCRERHLAPKIFFTEIKAELFPKDKDLHFAKRIESLFNNIH